MTENIKELIVAKGIEIKESNFGGGLGMLDIVDQVPKTCDMVILCHNSGGGYKPFWCGLSHQVYKQDLQEFFDKENCESVFALPVDSKKAFLVATRDKYAKQRWEKCE